MEFRSFSDQVLQRIYLLGNAVIFQGRIWIPGNSGRPYGCLAVNANSVLDVLFLNIGPYLVWERHFFSESGTLGVPIQMALSSFPDSLFVGHIVKWVGRWWWARGLQERGRGTGTGTGGGRGSSRRGWAQGLRAGVVLGLSQPHAQLQEFLKLKSWVCYSQTGVQLHSNWIIRWTMGSADLVVLVFCQIFSPRFKRILKQDTSNLLGLFSCGAVVKLEDARKGVQDFANECIMLTLNSSFHWWMDGWYRGLFKKIIGFTQASFLTSMVHSFVMDVALQNFIHGRLDLRKIMKAQQVLGAHTDVVVFEPGKITRFKWTHPSIRPMGSDISRQCKKCYYLKTLKVLNTNDNSTTKLKCSNCLREKEYEKSKEWSWADGSLVKGDERGCWLMQSKNIDV